MKKILLVLPILLNSLLVHAYKNDDAEWFEDMREKVSQLEDLDLSKYALQGKITHMTFKGINFKGASFKDVIFVGDVRFENCLFDENTSFEGATVLNESQEGSTVKFVVDRGEISTISLFSLSELSVTQDQSQNITATLLGEEDVRADSSDEGSGNASDDEGHKGTVLTPLRKIVSDAHGNFIYEDTGEPVLSHKFEASGDFDDLEGWGSDND